MVGVIYKEENLFFPADRSLSPASARRVVNLAKLLREMERRPLRLNEIAVLLTLTRPGARKYTSQLRDIGIVDAVPQQEAQPMSSRCEKIYVLNSNQALLRRCWAELLVLLPRAAAVQSAAIPFAHWSIQGSGPPQLNRDPLIAALFGTRSARPAD